jgi:hypothetical protein
MKKVSAFFLAVLFACSLNILAVNALLAEEEMEEQFEMIQDDYSGMEEPEEYIEDEGDELSNPGEDYEYPVEEELDSPEEQLRDDIG